MALSHELLTRVEDGANAAPPEGADADAGRLEPGTLVGEYRVERLVGEGGMGAVYAAVHPLIGRRVAIKVVSGAALTSQSASARFLQEARAATLVRHRNIVDVFAFGQLRDGRSYLVMDFLDGESLAAFLRRSGPLGLRAALPIVDGLLAGLQAAHDRGIIHRDLKPENVWLCPDESGAPTELSVRILDFGLAKLTAAASAHLDGSDAVVTRAGAPLGTPAFMSPEQCRGAREIDHRTDLYAVGVMLHELFTGEVPFFGATFLDVMQLHLHEPPPSLGDLVGMPEELEEVVHRALAKDPAERFQSAGELREALHACTASLDWSPLPRPGADGASPTGGGDATLILPEAPAGGAALPSLRCGELAVEPRLADEVLTLRFAGDHEGPDAATALGAYLGELTDALGEHGVTRVVVDLRSLAFLGREALGCLGEWLSFVAGLRASGLAPTTLLVDPGVRWQRAAVPSLQALDPALRVEEAEAG